MAVHSHNYVFVPVLPFPTSCAAERHITTWAVRTQVPSHIFSGCVKICLALAKVVEALSLEASIAWIWPRLPYYHVSSSIHMIHLISNDFILQALRNESATGNHQPSCSSKKSQATGHPLRNSLYVSASFFSHFTLIHIHTSIHSYGKISGSHYRQM